MFIRIKKIKNREYAYLVENKWVGNSSRQAVKSYLGYVCKPQRCGNEIGVKKEPDYRELILDIARQELINHGFVADGNLLKSGEITAELHALKFIKDKKPCVVAMNEGFLCSHTLKELLSLKAQGSEEEVGMELATKLLEAGLQVPKEEFIHIFEKVFK